MHLLLPGAVGGTLHAAQQCSHLQVQPDDGQVVQGLLEIGLQGSLAHQLARGVTHPRLLVPGCHPAQASQRNCWAGLVGQAVTAADVMPFCMSRGA